MRYLQVTEWCSLDSCKTQEHDDSGVLVSSLLAITVRTMRADSTITTEHGLQLPISMANVSLSSYPERSLYL